MIILDTNILSEFSKPRMDVNVSRWFERQDIASLSLCTIVVMEQVYGAELFLKRSGSDRYYHVFERLARERFQNRVIEWTIEAASLTGQLRARRESIGRAMSVQDAMIAAICLSSDATLATRNTKDFAGLDLRLLNPFEEPTANH
jgi:predicted nucleic acid-binding protein